VKIADCDAAERISFDAKVSLQVFVCGITEHNSSTDCQQNWPMKNHQERHEDEKAGDHATPKPPVTPRLCLIVLGHGTILLPVGRRAKRKCRDRSPTVQLQSGRRGNDVPIADD
jgi:hypothetical protein